MALNNSLETLFDGRKPRDKNLEKQSYNPQKTLKKMRDCGLNIEKLRKLMTKAPVKKINEEHGAGFEGTCELVNKYRKDTPGQSIEKKRKRKK